MKHKRDVEVFSFLVIISTGCNSKTNVYMHMFHFDMLPILKTKALTTQIHPRYLKTFFCNYVKYFTESKTMSYSIILIYKMNEIEILDMIYWCLKNRTVVLWKRCLLCKKVA